MEVKSRDRNQAGQTDSGLGGQWLAHEVQLRALTGTDRPAEFPGVGDQARDIKAGAACCINGQKGARAHLSLLCGDRLE